MGYSLFFKALISNIKAPLKGYAFKALAPFLKEPFLNTNKGWLYNFFIAMILNQCKIHKKRHQVKLKQHFRQQRQQAKEGYVR